MIEELFSPLVCLLEWCQVLVLENLSTTRD